MGPVKIRKFLDEFGTIENFLSGDNTFKGIDNDGLEDLYKRNKLLIDLKVAMAMYPVKKIPIRYYKPNKPNFEKLRELFNSYSLQSFKSDTFLEPFIKLQRWENQRK